MNPVPKLLFLTLTLAAASAHASLCPPPREVPEGEGIEASHHVCGAVGVFTQHGKKGFFDTKTGEIVVPAQFDAVYNDHVDDTLTPVRKGEYWAYVDPQGKPHTAYEYDHVSRFYYGDTFAIVGKNGHYGMINRKGEVAVPLEYDRLDGLMRPENGYNYLTVACKAGKCGYLDEKGKTRIALEYDDAGGFGADVAPVKKGDKWGYINAQGETVQPFAYEEAEAFTDHYQMGSPDQNCVEATKGGKRVASDPQGKTLPEGTSCKLLPPPLI